MAERSERNPRGVLNPQFGRDQFFVEGAKYAENAQLLENDRPRFDLAVASRDAALASRFDQDGYPPEERDYYKIDNNRVNASTLGTTIDRTRKIATLSMRSPATRSMLNKDGKTNEDTPAITGLLGAAHLTRCDRWWHGAPPVPSAPVSSDEWFAEHDWWTSSDESKKNYRRNPETMPNGGEMANPYRVAVGDTGAGPPVLNETFMLHGTTAASLPSVITTGLTSGFSRKGYFGNGIYLAEDPAKSDQYCKLAGGENRVYDEDMRRDLFGIQDDALDDAVEATDGKKHVFYMLVCRTTCGLTAAVSKHVIESHNRLGNFMSPS